MNSDKEPESLSGEKDSVLKKLLFGEIHPESSEGKEILKDDEVASAYRDVQSLMHQLDTVGADVREGAMEGVESAGLDQALDQLWKDQDQSEVEPSPLRIWVGGLLSAAAALWLFWVIFFGDESGQPHERAKTLGREGASLTLLAPDTGDPWSRFEWQVEGVEGLRYRVTVLNGVDGEIVQEFRTANAYWEPQDHEQWPTSISWRVEAFLPGMHDAELVSEVRRLDRP